MLRFHICFAITVYYKIQQMLYQNATAILLQNATEVYYKRVSFLLQNIAVLLQIATTLYKMRQL